MVVYPGHEAESDVIQSWMGKPAHIKCLYFSTLVSGDANFQTKHTALSVGGFIQPSVAKNLIQLPQNIEKGLCQRFLWLAPKPLTVQFKELQSVNCQFSASVGKHHIKMYVKSNVLLGCMAKPVMA